MAESKKYIVTGGAGFIGSHIVDDLCAQGHNVIVVDNLSSGSKNNINPKATFIEADIRVRDSFGEAISGADGIFHCAAIVSVQYSLEHPTETEEVNVGGTLNILEVARIAGIRRLVFSSSSAVYGSVTTGAISENAPTHPESPYGQHKLQSENDIHEAITVGKMEGVILRYFNVYGSRQRADSPYSGVIARFAQLKKEGKPLTILGDGSQTRDFVHVSDVVAANLLAMQTSNASGEIFNIGSGKETSVLEIAKFIGGEITHLPPRHEPKNSLADISKAKRLFGWMPRMVLEEGIRKIA